MMAFPVLPGFNLQRVFLQKCSSLELTIKLPLCVREREGEGEGEGEGGDAAAQRSGKVRRHLRAQGHRGDASPSLRAQPDPIGSRAAGFKGKKSSQG